MDENTVEQFEEGDLVYLVCRAKLVVADVERITAGGAVTLSNGHWIKKTRQQLKDAPWCTFINYARMRILTKDRAFAERVQDEQHSAIKNYVNQLREEYDI